MLEKKFPHNLFFVEKKLLQETFPHVFLANYLHYILSYKIIYNKCISYIELALLAPTYYFSSKVGHTFSSWNFDTCHLLWFHHDYEA
jgi:hypothetical protein